MPKSKRLLAEAAAKRQRKEDDPKKLRMVQAKGGETFNELAARESISFAPGEAYYQLIKMESVAAEEGLVLWDGKEFDDDGEDIRKLLGFGALIWLLNSRLGRVSSNGKTDVRPEQVLGGRTLFVSSKSPNRKLEPGAVLFKTVDIPATAGKRQHSANLATITDGKFFKVSSGVLLWGSIVQTFTQKNSDRFDCTRNNASSHSWHRVAARKGTWVVAEILGKRRKDDKEEELDLNKQQRLIYHSSLDGLQLAKRCVDWIADMEHNETPQDDLLITLRRLEADLPPVRALQKNCHNCMQFPPKYTHIAALAEDDQLRELLRPYAPSVEPSKEVLRNLEDNNDGFLFDEAYMQNLGELLANGVDEGPEDLYGFAVGNGEPFGTHFALSGSPDNPYELLIYSGQKHPDFPAADEVIGFLVSGSLDLTAWKVTQVNGPTGLTRLE